MPIFLVVLVLLVLLSSFVNGVDLLLTNLSSRPFFVSLDSPSHLVRSIQTLINTSEVPLLPLLFNPLQTLPPWASEVPALSPWSFKQLLLSLSSFGRFTSSLSCCSSCNISQVVPSSATRMCLRKMRIVSSRVEAEREQTLEEVSVLDLPELALECILERLPPAGLFNMAGVCHSLRERCSGDFLWERHMRQKWGGLIGRSAHREWKLYASSRQELSNLEQGKQKCLMRVLSGFWPVSWMRSRFVHYDEQQKSYLPSDSIMSWYLALETGKFWFPAQVYNRENGHVGFMLSCYDAELSYDSKTDTFQARYPPHGRRAAAIESGVTWDRLRAPPVDTPPHDLHITDCLQDLRPGDGIEIQWRRNKGFPYGWWYGVVGHLESCDGNSSFCRCHSNDTVVLEFNQYAQGSRWRCTTIDRKNHQEEGNEADGFYGGIRKLRSEKEISTWKQLWPTHVLE